MLDKTAAIAILARDCGKALSHNIPKVEQLRSYFKSSLVVVVENDSIDDTKAVLKSWTDKSEGVVVISENYHTKTMPDKTAECPFPGGSRHRMEKMCFYRNKYMDYLRNNNVECDYAIIIDIDVDDFSVEGVIRTIENAPNDWTALFANGRWYLNRIIKLNYYDGSALVLYPENGEKINIELILKEMAINKNKVKKYLKKHDYMDCISAFGGIGVYKYQYIKDLKYNTIENKRSIALEVLIDHVPFNFELYNKQIGKNYISSGMPVMYEKMEILTALKILLLDLMPFKLKVFLYEKIKRKPFPV